MKDWKRTEAYLRRIAETDGTTEDQLWEMRQSKGRESAESSHPLSETVIESWSRFRNREELSAQDKVQLEAVVLPNGLRPAFDVQDDTFVELPQPWTGINAHKSFLERCIRGIGRLNVPGHALQQFAGTAFIVGPSLILTNRHVAEVFCRGGGSVLTFTPGISPNIDLKEEFGRTASVRFSVSKPLTFLTEWDAALFRTDTMPAGVEPLVLAAQPPASAAGRLATIVGYPALDTRSTVEEILQQIQIFHSVFDKKRLQPGRLLGSRATLSFGKAVNALAHDCSTLGGNSGSALIDVEDERILGLHFAGEFLVANYSVPTWELSNFHQLRDEGVLFR